MKDTILIDFDGVIRHWESALITETETKYNLLAGTLFSEAFSPEHLLPAICGETTHKEWEKNVESTLSKKIGTQLSRELIHSWRRTQANIDKEFLSNIRSCAPDSCLVLVTNATDKLPEDLKYYGLDSAFDLVINSSGIGVAKPENEFFVRAIKLANRRIEHCVFIDDKIANVEAARHFGILSTHHKSTANTLQFIKQNCL